MVYLVEEWENLEKYARQASANQLTGLYQITEVDGKAEIRVWIGNCGFKKQFDAGDQKLVEIKDLCTKQQYTKISECSSPNDKFFNP